MSKTKHTPGPWTQGHSEQGRSCVWLAGHTEPSGNMGECQVWIDCNTEANARLIAAAPDLLVALERLAFAAECRDNTSGDAVRLIEVRAELSSAAANARAAIAAAKGE